MNEIKTESSNNPQAGKNFSDSLADILLQVLPYLRLIWKNKWKLITINGIILLFPLCYLMFIAKPFYTSTILILPDYGTKTSDLFSQFAGLSSLDGMTGGAPPTQLYQIIMASESVIADVIYAKYQTKKSPNPINLIDYYDIKPDESLPLELQNRQMFLILYQKLVKGIINTDLDKMTKILTVTVDMPESKLSADIANNTVIYLDKFIRTKRKTLASEQKLYLEARFKQVNDSLAIYEERLKIFSSQNRLVSQSPELQLELSRLKRNVEIEGMVYAELTKQLELVKLTEVKDTPVINVREFAKEPIIKTGPKKFSLLMLFALLSFLLTTTYLILEPGAKKIINRLILLSKSKK